jgi:hypothetical protein
MDLLNGFLESSPETSLTQAQLGALLACQTIVDFVITL